MKAGCPECGAVGSLTLFVSDADAKRFTDLVADLPQGVAKAMIGYIALFRPAKSGLRWSRALSLVREIEPMIRAAQISWEGTCYVVPAERWVAAMQQLADRPKHLTLPLKSHGYLLSMLAGEAEKVAAREEREHDERLRNRGRDGTSEGLTSMGSVISEAAEPKKPPPGWKGPLERGKS